MEIYQLRHFLAVAETESFTKGAERAAVTQPAVSASIAKLESELEARLFDRARREVRLTAAGRRVREMAARVLADCAGVKSELRAARPGAVIKFGVLATLPIERISSLCRHFRLTHPEVLVELLDGSATELDARLDGGKLEIALTSIDKKSQRSKKLRVRALMTERYVLVAPKDHRLAMAGSIRVEELHGQPFITRTGCETFEKTTEFFLARGIRPKVVYRTDQDERAIAMVRAGLGVALMPASYRHPEVVQIPIEDFPASRTIGLKWRLDTKQELLERFVLFVSNHPWAEVKPRARADAVTSRVGRREVA